MEQRQRYKQDFNAEYPEYRELYGEMVQRMQVFKQLKQQLSPSVAGKTREVSTVLHTDVVVFQ